jgi:hypothetical protein
MSDDFGRNAIDEGDDEDLMRALEQQMGANNMKVLIYICICGCIYVCIYMLICICLLMHIYIIKHTYSYI